MGKNTKWIRKIAILICMITALCSVSVSAASPKLNKKKLTLNTGASYKLVLKNTKEKVTWKSSNYVTAPISNTGSVYARKKGTATLTATAGGKKYTCKLTIKQPVKKVALNKSSLTLQKGSTTTLKATVTPADANNKKLTWTTSNKKVATVTSAGKIKAVAAGTAVITATAADGSKKKATCKITVKNAAKTATTTVATPSIDISAVPSKGQSVNAKKLIATIQGYSNRIKKDVAAGRLWVYGDPKYKNSFADQVNYVAQGNTGTTMCSHIVRWSLIEIGVMPSGGNIYPVTGNGGKVVFNSKAQNDASFQSKIDIITVNKTPRQLLAEGKLLPGDICVYNFGTSHINVYAGNNSFFDSGRGSDGTWKNGKFCFNSFGPVKMYMDTKVGQIVRLK